MCSIRFRQKCRIQYQFYSQAEHKNAIDKFAAIIIIQYYHSTDVQFIHIHTQHQ